VVNKLQQSTEYVQTFARIYPGGLNSTNIKDAIATYEQSLYTPNSRFDQFLRGTRISHKIWKNEALKGLEYSHSKCFSVLAS